ncbi:hypothetical protein B296_00028168 [Ensete ventricosum]|uniref:Uncharacterized protein n=1 Tax=Ensete ventricosum TaxID=4639 RepID=A0A426Y1Y7_ENSVE|nr:hypothetical protein B296_00028168 [Ensete ventricosum]
MSVEEPEGQAESPDEAGMSIFVRPKSMKDMCSTKVHKDDMGYYALYMSDLAQQDPDKEMRARWENLRNSSKMALFDQVHDAGRLIIFMDYRINNLLQEIDALKARWSRGGSHHRRAGDRVGKRASKDATRVD